MYIAQWKQSWEEASIRRIIIFSIPHIFVMPKPIFSDSIKIGRAFRSKPLELIDNGRNLFCKLWEVNVKFDKKFHIGCICNSSRHLTKMYTVRNMSPSPSQTFISHTPTFTNQVAIAFMSADILLKNYAMLLLNVFFLKWRNNVQVKLLVEKFCRNWATNFWLLQNRFWRNKRCFFLLMNGTKCFAI